MGDLANDAVNGLACQECGVYFVQPHGHLVVCTTCWQDYEPKERAQYKLVRATFPEVGDG